jgi:hypothetical protein
MVKRLVICAGLAVMVLGGVARAQSTASQVVTGYYSTTGCPSGQTSCFVQNGPGSGGSSSPTNPTYVAPQPGTYSNGQITIAAANVSQQAIAPGTMTHGGDLVNPSSATEPLYFAVGSAATTTSASPSLSPGTAYHFPTPPSTGQAVNVAAATAGHTATFIAY